MRRHTPRMACLLLLVPGLALAGGSYIDLYDVPPEAAYVGSAGCLDCHDDTGAFYAHSPHAVDRALPVPGTAVSGCEACHGPGSLHVEGEGDGFILTGTLMETAGPEARVAMCTQCHTTHSASWLDGPHSGTGVTCADCHADQAHFGGKGKPASHFRNPSEFCIQCHESLVGDFRLPARHRVLEGQISCQDCHDPHEGFAAANWSGVNDVCLTCHTEMAGPFVFEHEGVADEDCTVCHRPHGSMHDKLLTQDGNTLCLQCHYDIRFNTDDVFTLGTFPHGDVTGRCLECHGGVPSGENPHLLAGIESRCYDCHIEIHGSNVSPALRNQ